MNRLQYRIVFNKQRGQFMAVAEIALSRTKGGGGEPGASGAPSRRVLGDAGAAAPVSRGPPSLLALAAALATGVVMTLTPSGGALAQVKADPGAPRNQQPTVVNSANGTVQVNIQTPGAAGVSRNSYSQFDVDKRGVILNNARTDTSTQLGGWVQANPWLAKGGARVILNEVNSSAPSQLKGYVEVAGQRAEVIIANPAGIQVDGAGFINASGAVLTTGTPRFNADGSVAGFGVQGGLIRVDGQGLDASQADYTALLARAVELNAGLWAKEARIQTGTQVMTIDDAAAGQGAGEALAPSGERPRYALDSTALGGIYAQRITLVGTEAGLGVRQAGQVVGGQLTLRADGWLENTGTVYAQEGDATSVPALAVQSGTGVRNAGWMASRGSTSITAPELAGTAGSVTAAGLASDGTVAAGAEALMLKADRSNRQAGQLLAAGRLSAQAPTLDLSGAQAQAAAIAVDGTTVAARQALLIASGPSTASAGSTASGALDVTATGAVDLGQAQAQARSIAVGGSSVTADGANLSATEALGVRTPGQFNAQGSSLTGGTLTVSARDVDARQAQWLHLGTEAMSVRVGGTLTADDARIAGNAADMTLTAGAISAPRAKLEHYGTGLMTISAAGSLNTEAAQVVGARIDLGAAEWRNAGGRWTQTASDGAITASVAGLLDNRDARLHANGQQVLMEAGVLDNTRGQIAQAGGALTLKADRLDGAGGSLLAQGAIALSTQGAMDLNGATTQGRSIRITGDSLAHRGGEMAATDALTVLAGGIDNQGGKLQAGQALNLTATEIGNRDGQLHGGNVALTALRLSNAGQGLIVADGAMTLNAGVLDNTGQLQAQGALTGRVSGRMTNAGVVRAGADGTLDLGQLTQTASGTLTAQRALTVSAGAIDSLGLMASGLRADASLGGAHDLTLRATGDLRQGGALLASGALSANGADLDFSGAQVQGASVSVAAGGDLNLQRAQVATPGALRLEADAQIDSRAAAIGGADVALNARRWTNAGGVLAQTGTTGSLVASTTEAIDNTQGTISAQGGTLALRTSALGNAGGRLLHVGGGDLTLTVDRLDGAGGQVLADGQLTLDARGAVDLGGATTQAARLTLSAGSLDHHDGRLRVEQDATLDIGGALDNRGGRLGAGAALGIDAGTLTNQAGQIDAAGVGIRTGTLDNGAQGLIVSRGDLAIRASTWNNDGTAQATGRVDLSVTGTLANTGTVHAQGEVALTAGGLTQTATGLIGAQGGLTVRADEIAGNGTLAAGLKSDNTLAASGDLRLDVSGTLQHAGALLAGGALSASATRLQLDDSRGQAAGVSLVSSDAVGAVSMNRATWTTTGALVVNVAAALGSDGARVEAGRVDLTAASWSNVAGRWLQTAPAGSFSAAVTGLLDNRQGELGANGTAMTLAADRLDNTGGRLTQAGGDLSARVAQWDGARGQVLSAGTLTLAATGAVTLDHATTQAGQLTLTAGSLAYEGGQLLSAGDAVLRIDGAFGNRGGKVQANGTLDASALSLDNTGGQLSAQRVTLRSDRVDNGAQGLIAATGAAGVLTVEAGQLSNAGAMQSSGDATLTATGRFENTGVVHSQGSGAVRGDALSNSGTMASQGALDVSVAQLSGAGAFAAGLRADGAWAGAGDLSIAASRSLQSGGALTAAGDLGVTAPSLQLQGAQLQAATSSLRASAGDLSLDRAAMAVTSTLRLSATGDVGTTQAAVSAADIQLAARHWNNASGRLTQTAAAQGLGVTLAGDLNNHGGTIESAGASLVLDAGRVDNGAGRIVQAGGALTLGATQWDGAQGQVLATGALDWRVGGAVALAGATTQADSIRLIGASLGHDGGKMTAAQGLTIDVDGGLSNRGGTLAAGAALQVEGASVGNGAGGLMQSGGALRVQATGTDLVDNQGGRLRAGGDLVVDAAGLDNRGGLIGGDAALTVRGPGAVLNQQGTLLAQGGVSVSGASLANNGGRVASVQGEVALTTPRGLDNTQGSVLAAGAATLTTGGLINRGGEISGGTTLGIDTRGQALDNRAGRLLGRDGLTVRSGALDNDGGLLQSQADLSVDTAGGALSNGLDAGVTTPTGLRAQGALRLAAGAISNGAGISGGTVDLTASALTNRAALSGRALTLGVAGTLDNQGGQLIATERLSATAGQVLNTGGLIYGAQTLDLTSGGAIDNRSTSGANLGLQGGAVTLRAGSVDNRGGQMRADGDLRVVASQWLDNGGGVLSALGQASLGDGGADARASTLDLRNGGGKVWGGGGVNVTASGLNGGGEIASGGALSLTLGGDLANGAGTLLQARGDIFLTLGGNFSNQGVLRAGGILSIDARNIDNQASGELSSADTRLKAAETLSNRGLIDGDQVRVEAAKVQNLGSGRIYGGDLTVAGGELVNGAENGQSAVIASRGKLTVAMTGAVSNTGGAMIFADGDLSWRSAGVLNENATIEATNRLEMDVSGRIANSSVHAGAENLPQDPSAPRVLDSKAFISSGGDMRLAAGQIVNSGATIEARRDLLLQSADIQNLNPYLKWQLVQGAETKGFEFEAPGSNKRYTPDQVRVLWWVSQYGTGWSSDWGSEAKASLEPFIHAFEAGKANWSADTYNRKMLLPSERYPNEVFGRYLGGFGGDLGGMSDRSFNWRRSSDVPYSICDGDGNCHDYVEPGAHYSASDRIWSDFKVTPGDDAGLDAAMDAFFADTNSRLVGDFAAYSFTKTAQRAQVTQSSAGRIIVGGQLSVTGGGKILNDMSQVIGRDGVDIQSASINNRTIKVDTVEQVRGEVYRTYNAGSGNPNTGVDYTTYSTNTPGEAYLKLPVLGVGGAVSGSSPQARQQAGAVGGDSGAQGQQAASASTVNAGAAGAVGALGGLLQQAVSGSGAVSADRARTGWRAGDEQQAQAVRTQSAEGAEADAGLRVRQAVTQDATAIRAAEGGRVSEPSSIGFKSADPLGTRRLSTTDVPGRLRAVPVSLTLPSNSLFKLRTDGRSGYLVETDPRFADYRDWLSSDYLLRQMAVDPATTQKRLGDGFYEQRLVREQIGKLTGSTFLEGYASDEEMYRALMSNGATYAKDHQLRPGVALTEAQIAALTTDLVWLVEQSVTLADGSTQRVLVPQVYLLPRDGDLLDSGALIAGRRVDIALSGALENSGDLRASESLKATAQNIVNDGSMRGTSLALSAREDLRNIGGELTATGSMSLSAGRDLVIASTTASASTDTSQRTVLDRVASLTAGGVMVLSAGQDVVLDAARIQQTEADGGVLVQAGRDLKLGTVQTSSSDKLRFDADNHMNRASSQEVGTSIQAQGPVVLKAGQDLVAKGASVTSQDAVQLDAKRDLQLLAAQATESIDDASKHTYKGFLKSTTTSSALELERTTALGTTISGRTVVATAGQDLLVRGSNVVSDEGTRLGAGRDVRIESEIETLSKNQFQQTTTSGVMGSGGIGFTVGKRELSQDTKTTERTNAASTVGAIGGNVTIVAGGAYQQVGSEVHAPDGDVTIKAKSIDITEARDVSSQDHETRMRQTGLTVAVSASGIASAAAAINAVENMGKTDDSRMKALAAATAASKAVQAAKELEATMKALADESQKDKGITLSLTMGSSQSTETRKTAVDQAAGSTVMAGGKLSLIATGGGADSNVTVRGSALTGQDVLVLADNKINLEAAKNRNEQHSDEKSQSASVGVGISFGEKMRFGYTASASVSRGNSDGVDESYTNTQVKGGSSVTLKSGGDTTLSGAVVTGPKVVADVGGDLKIESLQDTAKFDSKSMSASASGTVGAGAGVNLSYSQSKVGADYAAVGEQSGIRAGDGGFQVNVRGNTDLKGGAITSSQAAIDAGKNSFSTGTLTSSDIENRSKFEATAVMVSAGTGGGMAGAYKDSGDERTTTRSTISAGSTTITSGDAGSLAVLDKLDRRATNDETAGKLAQGWDGQKLADQAKVNARIVAEFGAQAAKEVAGQLDKKAEQLRAEGKNDEAKKYEEGGEYRVAAHAVIGAMTGDLGGALGAAASASVASQLSDLQVDIEKRLKESGLGADKAGLNDWAAGLAKLVTGALASGVATLGGVDGAVAALNQDFNNRQLHESEKDRIKRLAAGDAKTEERLTAVACALVRCADGKADSDPTKASLLKSQNDVLENQEKYSRELEILGSEQRGGLFGYSEADRMLDASNRTDGRARYGALGADESVAKARELASCGSNAKCSMDITTKYDRVVSDRIEFNLSVENAVRLAQQCADVSCQRDAIIQLQRFRSDLVARFNACAEESCRASVNRDITPFRANISKLRTQVGEQDLFAAIVELGALGFTENAQNGGATPGRMGSGLQKRANGRGITNDFPPEKQPSGPSPRRFESPDPIVGKAATDIDAAIPGAVKDVNVPIRNEKIGKSSDADIMLSNGDVIEVKSGAGKGATTQVKNQGEIIGDGKEVMVYGPDLKPSVVKGLERSGVKVFKTLESLIEYMKSKGL